MPEPQNIYDNPVFFAGYEELRRTGSGLNELVEQPALFSTLPVSLAGLRVLDLGCGFGQFAREARCRGADFVLGIDMSARMLAVARQHTEDARIEYRQVGIEQLELVEGSFDLVVSSLALHYVENYSQVVACVAALLVKNGRFAFSVEHPICTAVAAQRWVHDAQTQQMYWPVDGYQSEGPRHTQWFVEDVVKYHRTLETYINGLLRHGFRLTSLKEPQPPAEVSRPGLDGHRRRPPFLVLAADRL